METIYDLRVLGYEEELSIFEFKAFKELTVSGGLSYDKVNETVTVYNQTVKDLVLTKEIIEAKAKEIEVNIDKEDVRTSIIRLCSTLTTKVKELMTFKNITPDQEERYKIKRDAALKDDVSAFELEGSIIGKDPIDLMNYVKQLTVEWENTNNTFLLKIDAIRVKLNSILELGKNNYLRYIVNYINGNLETVLNSEDILKLLSDLEKEYEESLLVKEEVDDEVEPITVLSEENQAIIDLLNSENNTLVSETTPIEEEELDYGTEENKS